MGDRVGGDTIFSGELVLTSLMDIVNHITFVVFFNGRYQNHSTATKIIIGIIFHSLGYK